MLQIGTFSSLPQPEDVASLIIDEAELKRLRECRVEDCEVRLSADGIERVRRDIDWHAADASRKASLLVRQLLVDYVARYRQSGAVAAMEYADRAPRLNVGREFASLIDADTIMSNYAPRLRRHLLEYPTSSADKMTDFVYWSKELVRGRPVISITHVATAAAVDDSPVAYAIGSKQIYAMHYYDASLGLTLLVPDRTAASPATYVVYLNRSRIDLFDGLFGGVARRIVAGRARAWLRSSSNDCNESWPATRRRTPDRAHGNLARAEESLRRTLAGGRYSVEPHCKPLNANQIGTTAEHEAARLPPFGTSRLQRAYRNPGDLVRTWPWKQGIDCLCPRGIVL